MPSVSPVSPWGEGMATHRLALNKFCFYYSSMVLCPSGTVIGKFINSKYTPQIKYLVLIHCCSVSLFVSLLFAISPGYIICVLDDISHVYFHFSGLFQQKEF